MKGNKTIIGFWVLGVLISSCFVGFIIGTMSERISCNDDLEYISEVYLNITWKLIEQDLDVECLELIDNITEEFWRQKNGNNTNRFEDK